MIDPADVGALESTLNERKVSTEFLAYSRI